MYAIIETGGKQHKVREGKSIDVEYLNGEVGDQIAFDRVILASDETSVHVGQPLLEGARVVGSITQQVKSPKVIVFKFKRRKGYRRKNSHRQLLTRVRIDQIELQPGARKKTKVAEEPEKPAAKKKAARKTPARKSVAKKTAVGPRKTSAKAAKKSAKSKKPDK